MRERPILTLHDGSKRSLRVRNGDRAARSSGVCPSCETSPFFVAGNGNAIERNGKYSSDAYVANAFCLGCKDHVGVLRAKIDTIFGLEADEELFTYADSRGIRVYG